MAQDRINYSDFFDFNDRSQVEKAERDLKELTTAFEGFSKAVEKINTTVGQRFSQQTEKMEQSSKSLRISLEKDQQALAELAPKARELAQDFKNFNAEKQRTEKVVKSTGREVDTYTKRLRQLRKDAEDAQKANDPRKLEAVAMAYAKTQKEANNLKNTLKQATKAAEAGNSEYRKAQQRLVELNKKIRDHASLTGKQTKEVKKWQREQAELDSQLKKFDKQLGQNYRNVGNYEGAMKNVGSSLRGVALQYIGLTALITGIARVMSSSFRIVKNYDQANANLASVLGKTREETELLIQDSQRLGAVTAFTATEVAQLQTEYARLGFSMTEILDVSESTLNFAVAVQTELPRAAAMIGSTLRAFQLGSEQTARVVDALTASTSKSALSFEKLETALTIVAPVAKSFDFTLEETTALLGQLTNAGFDASMAGTSLRNIILNLADSNGKLAKKLGGSVKNFDDLIPALIQLRESGIDLNETLQLTDKRSVAAFNQFLQTAEGARELKEALEGSGGAAEEMAGKQLNTLEGSLKLLNSAWEGLILSLEDGSGSLSKFFKSTIEIGTDLLTMLREINEYGGIVGKPETLKQQKLAMKDVEHTTKRINKELEKGNMTREEAIAGLEKQIANNKKLMLQSTAQQAQQMAGLDPLTAMFKNLTQEKTGAYSPHFKVFLETENTELMKLVENLKGVNSEQRELAENKAGAATESRLISLKDLNEELKRLQQLQEGSVTTGQYLAYQEQIEDVQRKINTLTGEAQENLEQFLSAAEAAKPRLTALLDELNKLSDQPIKDFIFGKERVQMDVDDLIEIGEDSELFEIGEKFAADFDEATQKARDAGFDNFADYFEWMKEQQQDTQDFMIDSFMEGFAMFHEMQARQEEEALDRITTKYDEQHAALDQMLSRNLISQQKYNERKKKLEEQQQREEAKIKTKQFKREKAASIVEATIAGAIQAVKVAANPALLPVVLALTAAKIGLIASQPIPQFEKGTDYAPEGLAMVDERGGEIITDRRGRVKEIGGGQGPRYTYLNRGDKVIPHKETEAILNGSRELNILQRHQQEQSVLQKALGHLIIKQEPVQLPDIEGAIERAMSRQHRTEYHIDENGFQKYITTGSSRVKKYRQRK